MSMLNTFYPSPSQPAVGILRRWAAPIPPAWASVIIEATTRPGDLVLDPFCQGDTVARAALRLGRSVAVADFNPAQTLAVRAAIAPPPSQTLARATSRLADSVKMDRTLHEAIQSLYQTRCPHCGERTPAESFTWDATAGIPTRKTLTCQACGWRGAAPSDTDDAARATEIEPLSLSHYFLIERLAPQNDALRRLAERLVALYTPRAQRALADMIRHMDGLDLSADEGEALRMVLLGCLDAGSTLNATPWDPQPPRRLETPRRYAELNIWHAFETLAASLRQTPTPPPAEWVSEAGQVLTGTTPPFAFVGRLPVRSLADALAGRARLVLGAPPRMNPLFWTLSWAWASWLWSPRAASALRPLVERKLGDWDWYAAALTSTLTTVRTGLATDGHLALRWAGDHDAHAALHMAAARAGYRVSGVVGRMPRAGARWLEAQAVWTRQADTPPRLPVEQLTSVGQTLEDSAVVAGLALLQAQGEPIYAESLTPVTLAEAARIGHLDQALGLFDESMLGLEFAQAKLGDGLAVAQARGVLTKLEDGRLWLTDTTDTNPALSERVERTVIEHLLAKVEDPHPSDPNPPPPFPTREGGEVRSDSPPFLGEGPGEGFGSRPPSPSGPPPFLGEGLGEGFSVTFTPSVLYAHFPGSLAPDAELVNLCLEAHGRQVTPGVWTAHTAIDPLKQAVNDLVILGEALGYSVQFPLAWAIDAQAALEPLELMWFAGGRPATRFVLQASALLSPHITPLPHAIPHCLVLPDRVARLMRLKLQRAPHLAQRLTELGWDFMVIERLHRWFTQALVDPETWAESTGLEERGPGDGQLRLFDGLG